MTSENWEEINEFDFEDDLAQRITVHSVVHHLNVNNDNEVEELEYQLVHAHKQPTYAAAAKWGNLKNKKSIDISAEDDINQIREVVSAAEKKRETKKINNHDKIDNNDKNGNNDNNDNSKDNKDKSDNSEEQKSKLLSDRKVDNNECNLENSSSKQSPPNINKSTSPPPSKMITSPAPVTSITPTTFSPTESDPQDYCKSSSRRHNNYVHKVSTQRLLEQLSSPITVEANADAVKGDTNRDPEYKKYKILRKSMRYKNSGGKSKDRKGNVDKRVEVW